MSDTSNTTTSPFSLGATLTPAAGEQRITREQAAAILAEKLRAAGAEADQRDADLGDKGGFAGFVQGAEQGLEATVGRLPNVATGVTKAIVNKALGGGKKADKYDKLAKKLAGLLPEEALYESVVGQIDRRQLLVQVGAGTTDQSRTIGGVTFNAGERELAGRLFATEQDQAVTAATGLAAARGITGDAAVKQYIDDTAGAFRQQGLTLGVSPSAPAALSAATDAAGTGAAQAGGQSGSFAEYLANGTSAATNQTPFLTDADVQALFRLSSTDLAATNDYINSLAQYRANINPKFADPFKVQSGTNPATGVDLTGRPLMLAPDNGNLSANALFGREFSNATTSAKGARGYSITEAKDLLYGMSKDEVAKMQNLLLRAGYFADANGKSTKPLFMGDATDQTTQRGWLALLGDSIRSGKPLFETLSTKALDAGNRFSNPDGTIAQDVVLTSSAAIAQDADTLGTKEIGRKLTEEEHAKVVEFIHGLEKTAQNTSNEPGAQTVENPDVQAELNKYLHDTFATEAAGKDTAETYSMFTQMLAGPGGGR